MNPKVIFTDSGLGGLTIMADFVSLAKEHNLSVDTTFFNAQYSRELGYKKMESAEQVRVFDRVLESIQKKYQPDVIAIACNTLSVVYKKTAFSKNSKIQVLDIIKVGQSLINHSDSNTIIEVAMPTTISSKIYKNDSKNRIAISSDVMLPDAIENGNDDKITTMLSNIFAKANAKYQKKGYSNSKTALFLGCTHFPLIKDQFLAFAKQKGISIQEILDPNQAFSQLVLSELNKTKKTTDLQINPVQVISRMPFQDAEIKNIAKLIETQSKETADGLCTYTLDESLF
ncbi:MAG TPA: hypothetical protein EYG92_08665 [Lutibacter sp.]|nr:hypothetical protein [Lutibacter sp.]